MIFRISDALRVAAVDRWNQSNMEAKASSAQRPQDALLLQGLTVFFFFGVLFLEKSMKNQKISRFARPTLTPNLLNFERTPLTETPNPLNLRPS